MPYFSYFNKDFKNIQYLKMQNTRELTFVTRNLVRRLGVA